MTDAELKNQISELPSKPGIYMFLGSKAKPLYIGKALNLKNRVRDYLKTAHPRLNKMISEAEKINYMETESDIEALILESQYIKKYKPDFNIMLRDDKQYGSVGFTNEQFPKIFITHQPQITDSYIGPFTDVGALKTTLRLLRKIFPYCTCTQTHHNYCLNYHIEKCLGFCCLKNNPELVERTAEFKTYRKNIKAIKDILGGKKNSLIRQLEKEMKILSNKHEYEKALQLQYKIGRLKRVFENASIIHNSKFIIQNSKNIDESKIMLKQLAKIINLKHIPHRIEAYDVANIQGEYAVGAMVVFKNGIPDKNEYRKFKIHMFRSSTSKHTRGDVGMLREILERRFKHSEWPAPDLIIVDGGKAQLNTAKKAIYRSSTSIYPQVIALTKNEKHMGHKIILSNDKEVLLSKLPVNIKNLLLNIDYEAHRFSISYYRKLHRKNLNYMV